MKKEKQEIFDILGRSFLVECACLLKAKLDGEEGYFIGIPDPDDSNSGMFVVAKMLTPEEAQRIEPIDEESTNGEAEFIQ